LLAARHPSGRFACLGARTNALMHYRTPAFTHATHGHAHTRNARTSTRTRVGRWLILQIQKKREIVVVAESDPAEQDSEKAFLGMKEHLTPENNRYVVIKLTYESKDGCPSEDIVLFLWRGSKTKSKTGMLYAGTCGALKSAIAHKGYHEYDSLGDLTHEDLVSRVDRK
jgi:hypothetical protein